MTTIYLIRHGEVYNPDNILYLRTPGFKISEDGHKQAAAAGEYMADKPLAAIFTSPQLRAQETAHYIARHHDVEIQTEERINEVHSPWQGRPLAEAAANNFDLYTGNEPPYELLEDIFKRTIDFVEQVRTDYPDQHVASITHGDVVKVMFMLVHQMPMIPETKRFTNIPELGDDNYPATASITQLTFNENGNLPELVYTRPY